MRQALFAVMLVAASFAGGAAVNGPGLRWAQDFLERRLGPADDEADDRDDSPPAGTPAVPPHDPDATIPAAPIPPLAIEPSERDPRAPAPAPKADAPPKAVEPEPVTLPSLSATEVPPLEPKAPTPRPAGRMADAAVTLASLAGKTLTPGDANEPDPADPAPERADGAADDWNAIRTALKAEGVSRHGFEAAEPDGRVRFFCLIPVAGRRAVGQYFEAEGADVLQAARAALRRVALWRATEDNDGSGTP